jgi:hypothetical protein
MDVKVMKTGAANIGTIKESCWNTRRHFVSMLYCNYGHVFISLQMVAERKHI